MLTSQSDVNAVCVTSDESVFNAKDLHFANSHSQRFDDKSIVIIGKNKDFKEDNESLFFEGSRYSFQLLDAVKDEKPTDDETPVITLDPIVDEPKGDEPKGDEPATGSANDEMSVKVLKSMAKSIDGYKSSMNKAELIELINAI